jgi:hypothetical protein
VNESDPKTVAPGFAGACQFGENHRMPKTDAFDATFTTLRGLLEPYARELLVQADTPGSYQLASRTMTDRIGRPLFVAAVQVKKNYVSYHLMPVYAVPELLKGISPTLKKRMQGKSCFNFTTIEPAQAKELSALTRKGIAAFKKVKMPWGS